MRVPLDFDEATVTGAVSTGHLPDRDTVTNVLSEALANFAPMGEGELHPGLAELGKGDPDHFGACIAGVTGEPIAVGHAEHPFTLQSISKAFVFALACEELGCDEVRERIGVNATGFPYNSVVAIEVHESRTGNPMVNAGALATTSLLPGDGVDGKWDAVHRGLSAFAGRPLEIDEDVFYSDASSGSRNLGMAHILGDHGRLACDPAVANEVYARQCSVLVTARDLAVMGATLADGGVNPLTGERVIATHLCKHVLAVMATAGLYEDSGDWLFDVGLPGKSGVGGGIVTVAPGKGALGVLSPLLDEAGNSVRGQLLTRHVVERLGLNVFASRPAEHR